MPTLQVVTAQTDPEAPSASRGRARRAAIGLLFRAYPWRASSLAALAILGGVAPAIFAALVGQLVESPAQASGILVWVAAVLVGRELLASGSSIVWADLYRRYDEYLMSRVMGTTMRLPALDAFEEPELAARTDRAVRISRFGPGELVSGLQTKWGTLAQGFASTVLISTIWPMAALALLPLWLFTGRFLRADIYRSDPFWASRCVAPTTSSDSR